MATKKSATKNKAAKKTILIKIAEAVGTLAGEISVKKDRLTNMASDAIDSVKATIQDIAASKKITNKKKGNSAAKSPAKAPAVSRLKKDVVAKKAVSKVTKKATASRATAVNKVVKAAPKKAAPAKKAAPKNVAAASKVVTTKKVAKPIAKKAAKK